MQHANRSLEVRLHTGARRFQKVAQDLPQVQLTDVLVTDLDGDGYSDLYLVTPEADVALLGDGTGLFRDATRTLGLVENGVGVSAERLDLDGDGLFELVLHNRDSDVLFWAESDGRFERELLTTTTGPLEGPTAVRLIMKAATQQGGATAYFNFSYVTDAP